jgi:8-oxo-dGTP pyrophosphatase MutT (NUDIX family)
VNQEKSCGAVVYRKYHGNTEILLIRHIKSGYWSFPKGHVEEGETEEETAIREVFEETGLNVYIDGGFRETVMFSPKKDYIKTVVYFVARVKAEKNVKKSVIVLGADEIS